MKAIDREKPENEKLSKKKQRESQMLVKVQAFIPITSVIF